MQIKVVLEKHAAEALTSPLRVVPNYWKDKTLVNIIFFNPIFQPDYILYKVSNRSLSRRPNEQSYHYAKSNPNPAM